MLASYALQVFLHTMIKLCCCVSGNTCSYDSRASQILELGVSEREKEKKKILASCYRRVSKMRFYYSTMLKFLRFKIFDVSGF